MKSTAVAHSNIAFIKYWGNFNSKLNLPMNGSISMSLSNTKTTTTVEFSKKYKKDMIIISGKKVDMKTKERIINHLNRIRKLGKVNLHAKVISENNFPTSSGIASSASGFAALTLAATSAIGLNLSKKELSIISRLGSGSACRSIFPGYVEWTAGKSNETSYAKQIVPPGYWNLRDIIAIVTTERKKISSREGHKRAKTSPLYQTRLYYAHMNLPKLRTAIINRDIHTLGKITELDTILMHVVMMTSKPPIYYWNPNTIRVIQEVRRWRDEGLETYFTIDAGPNVHILTLARHEKKVINRLKKIEGVKHIIPNKPAEDAHLVKRHLF